MIISEMLHTPYARIYTNHFLYLQATCVQYAGQHETMTLRCSNSLLLRKLHSNLVPNHHEFLTPLEEYLRTLRDFFPHDIDSLLTGLCANEIRVPEALDYLKRPITADEIISEETNKSVLHCRRVYGRIAHELFKPPADSSSSFYCGLEALDQEDIRVINRGAGFSFAIRIDRGANSMTRR